MIGRYIPVLSLVLATSAAVASGRIIHVDNDGPADFTTIQAAVDDAHDGDVVLVAPGTYTGDGNRDIRVFPKAITIKSESGPQTCIIDCGGDNLSGRHQGFILNGDDVKGRAPTLEGFTITGAHGAVEGGGVCCYGGSPRIVNCRIVSNNALMGGGVACRDCSEVVIADCIISGNMAPSSDEARKGISGTGGGLLIDARKTTLTNCLITGNRTTGTGGAMACGDITLVNCTISGNSAPTYGGISGEGWRTIRNSIVCGNTSTDIGSPDPIYGRGPIYCQIEYSLVGSAPLSCKPKGVDCPPLDRLFARTDYWDPNGTPDDPSDDFWVEGDYHLKSQAGRWDPASRSWVKDDLTSPAIDAGDPGSPVGEEPFPNGGRVNMGAYGGTAEASKSYFGGPVCETMIPGDINGDCRVDFADWAIMASHWLKDAHAVPAPLPPPGLPKR